VNVGWPRTLRHNVPMMIAVASSPSASVARPGSACTRMLRVGGTYIIPSAMTAPAAKHAGDDRAARTGASACHSR
jgi:hypothetical protein